MNNKDIFENLYKDINGFHISWNAREKVPAEVSDHIIYGEFSYDTIVDIYNYEVVKQIVLKKKHFCDLGSGIGKICVEMSLEFPNLESITGIELLTEMVQISEKIIINNQLFNKISYINDNFFNADLSKYDLFFMHYPMKDAEELYLKLEEKMASELSSGALVVSMIRNLKDVENFNYIGKKTFQAKYGNSTAYYYVKK